MTLTRFHRVIIITVVSVILLAFVIFLVKSQANRNQSRFRSVINGSLFRPCEPELKEFKTTFTLLKNLEDRMKVYDAYMVCTGIRDCVCTEMGCSEQGGHYVLKSEDENMKQVGELTGVCCDIIDQASQKFAMSKERWDDWIKDSLEPDITGCDVSSLRFQ